MDMSNLTTPREIDTALAAKYHELAKTKQQLAYSNGDMFTFAGAKYSYRGRQRVPNMTLTEAIEKANERVAALQAYMDTHSYTEKTSYGEYTGVKWDEYKGPFMPYEARRALEAFPKRAEREREVERVLAEIDALEDLYTGWSRFFLVTSSTGHVHSSMHCSTCRPTTTYGWLPELSGKTEAEAVEQLGPNLCSICFASAPVEHVGGKITKAKAAKLAA